MIRELLRRFMKNKPREKREYTREEINESCERIKMVHDIMKEYGDYNPFKNPPPFTNGIDVYAGPFNGDDDGKYGSLKKMVIISAHRK